MSSAQTVPPWEFRSRAFQPLCCTRPTGGLQELAVENAGKQPPECRGSVFRAAVWMNELSAPLPPLLALPVAGRETDNLHRLKTEPSTPEEPPGSDVTRP